MTYAKTLLIFLYTFAYIQGIQVIAQLFWDQFGLSLDPIHQTQAAIIAGVIAGIYYYKSLNLKQ